LTNVPGAESYPITSFTWIYLPTSAPVAARAAALSDLLDWIYSDGQRSAALEGYSALLPQLLAECARKPRLCNRPGRIHPLLSRKFAIQRTCVSIFLPRRSAGEPPALASKMAEDEAAKDPNIVSDATGELCNMVAGNFKAKITSLADHCMLSVRTVITGENYTLQSAEPSESLQVALLFESSPIQISLITQS
jgi:hypothetical protein